jgi:YegS/Rv2252/BmrU family lipid kinase
MILRNRIADWVGNGHKFVMATPHRYPLIFNPKARSQRGQRALRFLMERANHFALYATNNGDEARELAARFAAEGEPVVIAAGGDGTLNAVVCGLAGSQTALAVLPTGTMNVFARELGIPFDNLAKAFEVIERGFIREIDLFEANHAPFVQLAGIGFDAQVIEETTWESKKALGPLAYLLAAVKVLGERPPPMEVICADGHRETGVAVLVGNGSLYGGQFKFFRKADNQDSKLDLLVYKEPGYRLVLDSLRGLASGGIDLVSSTSYLQTESCVVRAEHEMPVEVDGELLGRFKEVRFAPAASRLRVVAPEEPISSRFGDAIKTLMSWNPWAPAAVAPRTP